MKVPPMKVPPYHVGVANSPDPSELPTRLTAILHDRSRTRARLLPARIALGLAAAITVSTCAGFAQSVDPNLWVTNGPVYSIVRDGGTIYIGGSFSRVGP